MARIRGARRDAFRTGLPRLFKNVDPFRKPEASGKPCVAEVLPKSVLVDLYAARRTTEPATRKGASPAEKLNP
jgi:hypothetical protein